MTLNRSSNQSFNRTSRRSGWRTRDLARGTVVVLLVYAACRLVYSAHTLIFVAFLGILLGLAVSSGVDRLERWRVPRALGAGLIVVGAVALLAGFGAWTGPTVRSQYRELRERLPDAFSRLDHWLAAQQGGLLGSVLPEQTDSTTMAAASAQVRDTITVAPAESPDSLSHLNAIKQRVLGGMGGASRYVLPVIHSTIEAVSGVILVLFLAIYIGASPGVYRRGILALIPRRAQARWEQVLTAAGSALRR